MVEATRTANAHALNDRSSRSHCVLGAELTRARDGVRSRMLFVDLAGSERIKKSGAVNMAADEARSINASLSALQRVVVALARRQKFVPYRDSTLTLLLEKALSGSVRLRVVVTVSGEAQYEDETRNSLRFAREMASVTKVVERRAPTSVTEEIAALSV